MPAGTPRLSMRTLIQQPLHQYRWLGEVANALWLPDARILRLILVPSRRNARVDWLPEPSGATISRGRVRICFGPLATDARLMDEFLKLAASHAAVGFLVIWRRVVHETYGSKMIRSSLCITPTFDSPLGALPSKVQFIPDAKNQPVHGAVCTVAPMATSGYCFAALQNDACQSYYVEP